MKRLEEHTTIIFVGLLIGGILLFLAVINLV